MNLCFCFIKMDLFWFTYGFSHVIFSLLQPAEEGQCQSTTEFFRAQCGFWDNISFIWSYYSYGSNYVSSSCAGHGVCWFHWLILHFSEFGNMLIQIMVLCFALALMALLCWESYLVERMKECNTLFLPVIHVNCFIMQIPEVLVHPYVNCLIVLINPVTYLGFVESGVVLVQKTTFGWGNTRKHLECCFSCPVSRDFTPEQASNLKNWCNTL